MAVGGATADAAGLIGTRQLRDRAVTTRKIANHAVTGRKLANGAITARAVRRGSLTRNLFAAGAIPPSIAARATNSASVSIATNVETKLAFDQEAYDTAKVHDLTTNSSRLTAPVAGIYAVEGEVAWAPNPTGARYLAVVRNGTTHVAVVNGPANTATFTEQTIATEVALAAGDFVELHVFQTSGAPLQELSVEQSPVLAMHWVASV
jgi:hypothetical protein